MSQTTVDARGKSCPLPIVLLAKAARQATSGAVIVIQADDRAFPADIAAWCERTKHELISLQGKDGSFEAHVRKP